MAEEFDSVVEETAPGGTSASSGEPALPCSAHLRISSLLKASLDADRR